MTALPTIRARELLRVLLKAGFYIHHQRGSHARLLHKQRADLKLTLPVHNKDMPEKTLRRIIRQAGMSDEDFLKLLRK